MCKKYLFTVMLFGNSLLAAANVKDTAIYPQKYFRNPLSIPILLAGSFGECRPDHWHSGIDIKTLGRENQPVYAAADGYISRVKFEKGGYGHVIYITHPNGYTTVYGHLNNFMKPLQDMVKSAQYAKEDWQVDLAFPPSDFPVKKGKQIAWSGNTGSSTAPHLHFEIRDTKTEHALNPLLFGLPVKDNIPPKPEQIAFYNLSKLFYDQEPVIMKLVKKGNAYHPEKDTFITSSEYTTVGLNVSDYMNGSENPLNFYTASLYMSDALIVRLRMDNIGFDEMRYLNAYADYKTKQTKGTWIQCLFQIEGNYFPHVYEYTTPYRQQTQRGRLEMGRGQTKPINIELRDASGNLSIVSFYLQFTGTEEPYKPECERSWFFIDRMNSFANGEVAFTMDSMSLYEPTCFQYNKTPDSRGYSDRHEIHKAYMPLHKSFDLYLKPNKEVPDNLKTKIAMAYNDGKEETASAAMEDNGWYKLKVRKFGEYRLIADTEPPVIKPLQQQGADMSKAAAISFNAKDAITSVKSFRGELDGKWVCFEQKGDVFVYNFDEHCLKGKHELKITAADENDNAMVLSFNFTR